jgi:phenylpropionate dioxygenase-like ring-hydroxylating dioxygenase large terminal subunit
VLTAFCRHLGATCPRGSVVGDEVRCEFHHWQYGGDGRCTRIPAGGAVPEQARLFSFPVAERWGLIWAFNGEQPLFDPPASATRGRTTWCGACSPVPRSRRSPG